MYFASYHLSKLGWNAMPTARNARGIDIVVYNKDCSEMLGLQIKTLSKRNPVPLGSSLSKIMGDFWIIVTKAVEDSPVVYILKPSEVKELAHRGEKNGRVSYWLQPKAYDQDEYRESWSRIGRGDDTI